MTRAALIALREAGEAGAGTVVTGVVEHGDARGRTLGFPTANLPLDGACDAVRDGVYAGWFTTAEGRHLTAVSVGRRPTYYGRDGLRLLEAHLLDFAGDLYGVAATVHLAQLLRLQRRFSGTDDLVAQLQRDVEATRSWAGREAS